MAPARTDKDCETCDVHSGIVVKQQDNERRIALLEKAIIEIRDRLLGRPSWMVTVVVTVLSSAVIGLLVALASRGASP